jgi:penicillin-binding protein 1A
MASHGAARTLAPGARRTNAAPSRARRRRRSRARTVAKVLLVGVVAGAVGATTFVAGLLAAPIDFAVPPPPTSALLLASDGRTQFATIPPPQRRTVVPAQDIPNVMRKAMISAEDERFLEHKGVDPLATIRAAYRDLTGAPTQGGSTLTQQYVKNVYVGNDRTALRKVKEAALAVRLENKLSKDEILTDYLNVLYLGNNVYGVQAAARYYFGVDVKDLDKASDGHRDKTLELARATLLAGIAPAPSAWNPVTDYRAAKARQHYTLNQMIKLGYVSSDEASAAYLRPVKPVREALPELPTDAPEFADLMKAQLQARFKNDKEQLLFEGGLRVRTTMDNDLQTAAAQALHEVLPGADLPEAAVAAIDIRSGDVRAMSTLRRDPKQKVTAYQRNGLNLATSAHRSTGSTIKPFTLAVALQQGHSLDEARYAPECLRIPDRTVQPGGVYKPCNADVKEAGTFTLRRALADSVNTIYIPLAKEVGRAKIRDLMLKAGVQVAGSFNADVNSFGLGTTALATPLSLADAYATLVNHGVHANPRFFSEIRVGGTAVSTGRVLTGFTPSVRRDRVLKPEIADQVTEAMKEVVDSGTGSAARQPFPVYGKTGTTDKATDAWFVGCVRAPQYVCIATWMGYEDHRSMHDIAGQQGLIYGGTLPAKIFARTFEILRQIQADRKVRLAGQPVPTVAPTATFTPFRRRRPTPPPAPRPTASRSPTRAPLPTAPPAPSPTPTPPPILPTQGPPGQGQPGQGAPASGAPPG